MRSVYIGDSRISDGTEDSLPGYEVYRGYEGYRLLLQITCGLKSRLLGETEVFAQFKQRFSDQNLNPNSPFESYLKKLRDQIITDVKAVRSGYLENLGDQSYGGLAHRYLGDRKEVILFGTGQLAEKMLPWLQKSGRNVTVVGRNEQALKRLSDEYGVVSREIQDLDKVRGSFVIAAPIGVQGWISTMDEGEIAVDFREIAHGEVAPPGVQYVSFEAMLSSLQERERKNEELKKKLDTVLQEFAREREMRSQELVFGWEDVPCLAY